MAATQGYRLTRLEESPKCDVEQVNSDEPVRRRFLPSVIDEYFGLSGLRLLAHRLDVDFENLEGETKEEKALSLVLWMQRNGRFGELIGVLGEERPLVDWEGFR